MDKCQVCGESKGFVELSGGGGAEMHRCRWCGAVYNVNPFGIELVQPNWFLYANAKMFPLPEKYKEMDRKGILFCHQCGNEELVHEGLAEGYSCPKCGSSDQDE